MGCWWCWRVPMSRYFWNQHTHRAGAAGPNSRMRRNQWTQSQRQPGFGTYQGTSPATSPVQQFCQSLDVAVTVSVEVSWSQSQLSCWKILKVSPSSRTSLWKWCIPLAGRWCGAQWCPVMAVCRGIAFLGQDLFLQSFFWWVCRTSPLCLQPSQLSN